MWFSIQDGLFDLRGVFWGTFFQTVSIFVGGLG